MRSAEPSLSNDQDQNQNVGGSAELTLDGLLTCILDDRGPPHRLCPAHFLIESPFCRFLDIKGKATAIGIDLIKIAGYIRDVYIWRILQGYDVSSLDLT